MTSTAIIERFGNIIRPTITNFQNEQQNAGFREENKSENLGSGLNFTSQMSNELPKYNNMYTCAGQTNISISPSSIPNPNPSLMSNSSSSMGMKVDQSFHSYGPYIFPMQSFPGYQTIYPPNVSVNQSPITSINQSDSLKQSSTDSINQLPIASISQSPIITQDKVRFVMSNPLDQMNVPIQSELEKTENILQKPSIIESKKLIITESERSNITESDKLKDDESHQTPIPISIEKDNIIEIGKSGSPVVPDFVNVNAKSVPLKVDKQTGPGANSFVKILKGSQIIPSTTIGDTTTNILSANNGPFTLKTSIPISKIDMRTIQAPINSIVKNIPPGDESKQNEIQTVIQSVVQPTIPMTAREQGIQIDSQINTKNDSKQNFFPQGNAVVHPHNIIKMLVPSQPCDIQTNAEINRNKPQIISDILLKPKDTLIKPNENITEPFANNNQITISNSNVNIFINENNTGSKLDNLIKPITDGQQLDKTKDLKKQYVFIPNSLMANKLLLSISSKGNPIMLPKVQTQEDGRISNSTFAIPQLPERLKETVTVSESSIEANNKIVALKTLHHESYDENDFENLITENQIYGNKIVIKEKSQSVFVHPANMVPNQNQTLPNETVIAKEINNAKPNIVVQPNFLYVGNYKIQPNISNFMLVNNDALTGPQSIDDQSAPGNEMNIETINHATSQNKVMLGTQTFRTVIPTTHTVSYVKTTNIIDVNKQGTVLQTLLSKPKSKPSEKSQVTKPNGQKLVGQVWNNRIVYQVPKTLDRNNLPNRAVNVVKPTYLNSELATLLTKTKNEQMEVSQIDSKSGLMNFNETGNQNDEDDVLKILHEEESSLDLAEKKKIAREKRRLLLSKKSTVDQEIGSNKEKEKYLSSQHYYYEEDSDESEYLSEDEDVVNVATKQSKIVLETGSGKLDFLNTFGLTTKSVKKEKELDKLERSIKMDLITSANVAAKADKITKQIKEMESVQYGVQAYSLPVPNITENPITNESKEKITDKIIFMNELKLGMVPHSYKIEHEMMWQHVLKDRKKRNGDSTLTDYLEKLFKAQNFSNNNNSAIDIHSRDQLEIMTKIKQSVLENNNLIKLKLDKLNQTNESDNDIPSLAEKNFSEIQKLSCMANKSLTILRVTQDLKDAMFSLKPPSNFCNLSEQQKTLMFPTFNNRDPSHLNIPKIISLKSTEVQCNSVDILPATSMDEPRNSAGGVSCNENGEKYQLDIASQILNTQTAQMQTDNLVNGADLKHRYQWPGTHAVLDSYKVYSTECEIERLKLLEKNEMLRNEIALKENDAGRLGAQLSLLMAEQQMCEEQRQSIQRSIDTLTNCITQIRA